MGITLWEAQKLVAEALIDKRRIAVRSGHGVGKTFIVACIVLWWLYARKGLVVTTAPTWEHVEGVLWREINSIAERALVPLPGTPFQTERRITNTWYALGLSTNKASAFQGRHHPRLLVVLDEAPGVDEQVHLEVSTLATGEKNCILMIGNPTQTSGTFWEAFKRPDIWFPLHINCLDHPNVKQNKELIQGAVTRGWVEERMKVWGVGHPFWHSRVLGDFPPTSTRGVIPMYLVERAMNEEERARAHNEARTAGAPIIFGLDVARYGENKCVLIARQGDAVILVESWHHASTMETSGRVTKMFREMAPQLVIVDEVGVGAGVVDRLRENGLPIIGFNSGHRAFTPGQFANRRSELWWLLRNRFEHRRLWLPKHDILFGELIAPEYEHTSAGRVRVESKETMLERGVASPDHADALVMSFANEGSAEAFLYEVEEAGIDPNPVEWEISEAPYSQLPAGF